MKVNHKFIQSQRGVFDLLVKYRNRIEDKMRTVARRIALSLCPYKVGQILTNGICYWKIVAIFPTGGGLDKGKKIDFGVTVDRVTKSGRRIESNLTGHRRYLSSSMWGRDVKFKLRKYVPANAKSKLPGRVHHRTRRRRKP